MSKELEILKQIKRVDGNMSREQNQRYAELELLLTKLKTLKRYPTSEEVCKALQSELEYGTVEYFEGNREFMFVNHGEKANITDCYGDRYKVTGSYKSSTLSLIGRFYEGMEKICK